MKKQKVIYVCTVPKAGTYFIAGLLELAGFHNSGLHVAFNETLDTKSYSMDVNAKWPSKTAKKVHYLETIGELKPDQVFMGHMSPSKMLPTVRNGFKIVAGFRHPRLTLVSEFLDFRLRRSDVPWLSKKKIEDDKTAFVTYLKRHGPIQHKIFIAMFSFFSRRSPVYQIFSGEPQFVTYDFDLVRGSETGPREIQKILRFLGKQITLEHATRLLSAVYSTQTKTRAIGIEGTVPRGELWTDAAEQAYQDLQFPKIASQLESLVR